MPPPMGMMPPMAPPGFPGTNPWLAAAAAMGQMTGMPMMPPPGYPNPLMPPPFSPELGYPPGVYPPYPMQPSVPTERRGSTDRRNSTGDRSHRKGSTGQAMTSQKSDPAEKKSSHNRRADDAPSTEFARSVYSHHAPESSEHEDISRAI